MPHLYGHADVDSLSVKGVPVVLPPIIPPAYNPLLGEVIVAGAPVNIMSLSGLDCLAAGGFKIVFSGRNNLGGIANINFVVQGDLTIGNYRIDSTLDGVTSQLSSPVLCVPTAATNFGGFIEVIPSAFTNYWHAISRARDTLQYIVSGHRWPPTNENITQVAMYSESGAAFAVGSRMQVFKNH